MKTKCLIECFEIGFNFYAQIKNKQEAAFQFCNLNELNASAGVNKNGKFSEEKFYANSALSQPSLGHYRQAIQIFLTSAKTDRRNSGR